MKRENGQSLVEFALIVPVLLILLFGIIDFGRIFHSYLTIDHAGREAARAASVGKTNVKEIANINGESIGLATKGNVSYTTDTEKATVTITYPVNFLTPLIGKMVGPLNLKNTTVMRIEK